MKLKNSSQVLLVSSFLSFLSIGCGKSVDLSSPTLTYATNNSFYSCSAANLKRWFFTQPSSTSSTSVDILFVIDTSHTMKEKLNKISTEIPLILRQLNPSIDFRVGVMLAYGQSTSCSGSLFTPKGYPTILDSKAQTLNQMESSLQGILSQAIPDQGSHQVGKMLSTVLDSISSDHLSQIQAEGFYRPAASLAIVFVSDHADSCQSRKDSLVESLYSQLKSLKGKNALLLAGLVPTHSRLKQHHPDPDTNNQSNCSGVADLLAKDKSSIWMDITSSSYSTGLTQWADTLSQEYFLQTRFDLSGKGLIDPNSVRVAVDDKTVIGTVDTTRGVVDIDLSDAGHSGSSIEVTACGISP